VVAGAIGASAALLLNPNVPVAQQVAEGRLVYEERAFSYRCGRAVLLDARKFKCLGFGYRA